MNHYEYCELTSSAANSARRASPVAIPSGAWVKSSQLPAATTWASAANSRVSSQGNPPRRLSAAELARARTAARDGDRDTTYRSQRNPVQRDAVLGVVAVGTLFILLAWVVTGIEVFAVIGLLIAAGSVTVAFTRTPYGRLAEIQIGHQTCPELPRPLRHPSDSSVSPALMRIGNDNADDGLPSNVSTASNSGRISRSGRNGRSAYDGLAD